MRPSAADATTAVVRSHFLCETGMLFSIDVGRDCMVAFTVLTVLSIID
jgi:hypothetical protein